MKKFSSGFSYLLFHSLLFFTSVSAQDISLSPAQKIDDGFLFTEGPVWKDSSLLFSDINGNRIYKWSPDSGTSVFLDPAGGSNGLALNAEGKLIIAGHQSRNVTRMEDDGTLTVLADSFNNKRLNSPNDLAIKSDGSIFFTDPPWGIQANQGELGYAGIYRLSPNGEVQLLDKTLSYPNGLAFSPDERLLYADESVSTDRRIFVWDVVDDTTVANKRLFANVGGPVGSLDGMKVDDEGNLFCASPMGIVVFAPDGTALDTVAVPGQTTNCNWGPDQNVLYVTSGNAIYRIDITRSITEVKEDKRQGSLQKSYKLYNLYPNPFNSQTKINFYVEKSENVQIRIFDSLGKIVDEVANSNFGSGRHTLSWNSSGFSSGIYYVQLATNSGAETKKIMLLK